MRKLPTFLFVALVFSSGCDGQVIEPGPGQGVDLLIPSMHRLTRSQYENSVRDIFGQELSASTELEPDVALNGLTAVGAASTTISPRGVELYEDAAFEIASSALADEGTRNELVTCQPQATVDDDCARKVLGDIGLRAWRRPLSEEELERYVAVSATSAEALGDFHEGLEFGIAGLLQSPSFLFRIEVGERDPVDSRRRRFTSYEMASRLSYLLWNSAPDGELLAAAGRDELIEVDGLRAQAERLLQSPRARDGVRRFFSDLLNLESLSDLSKDTSLFPEGVNPAGFGPVAREETLSLVEHLVFDSNSDLRNIFTTRTTFVNRDLARLYDLPEPEGEGFSQVEIPEDYDRAGLLGHASLLSIYAHSSSSSPTLRGAFVRQSLLCQAIPAPPPDVDAVLPEVSTAPTARERLQVHQEDPTCAGCHRLMDPIGLSLEKFDAIGKWRAQENGVDIDPSGELDGVPFDDAKGLGQALSEREDLGDCLTLRYFSFATGHMPTSGQSRLYTNVSESFRDSGYRFNELMLALITSDGFRGSELSQ